MEKKCTQQNKWKKKLMMWKKTWKMMTTHEKTILVISENHMKKVEDVYGQKF